jgi:hypothetical protein
MSAHGHIDELVPHMKRAGFVATGLAALITAQFGWALGESVVASISLAGLLALCTFIVGYALTAAWSAYKRGLWGVGHAAVALFAVACCVEFLSHLGYTAAHRDASISQAGLQRTVYEDGRAAVTEAQRKLATIDQRLSWMEAAVNGKPVRTVDAADQDVAKAEAHRFWAATESCTRTTGPQTRSFCDAYRTAVAERSLAGEKVLLLEERKMVADAAAKARQVSVVQSASAHGAAGASQGRILASVVTLDAAPDEQKQFWAGVGISALLALFAIAAGGLLNFVAYGLDGGGSPAPAREVPSHMVRTASAPVNSVRDVVYERIVEDKSAAEALAHRLEEQRRNAEAILGRLRPALTA